MTIIQLNFFSIMVMLYFHQYGCKLNSWNIFFHIRGKCNCYFEKKYPVTTIIIGLICSLRNLLTHFIFSDLGDSTSLSFPWALVPDSWATQLIK